jgi:hypothetical protein
MFWGGYYSGSERRQMSQANTQKVKRVIELRQPVDIVNEYLSKGWILLNVFAEPVESDHGPGQSPAYVLGWAGKGEPPN